MTKLSVEQAKTLAQEVLSRQQRVDVRLVEITLTTDPPSGEAQLSVDTAVSLGAKVEEGAIVCGARYEILTEEGEVESPAPDRDRFRLAILMHGQWSLSSSEGLTADHAKAFALAVGAMTLHPYVRAHVQALTTAAGYPPFTLGVLPSLLAGDEEGNVDLGNISAEV